MQSDLAPIVLFVYNRPEHTLQTLEALSKNELASDSLLYIQCDGPKPDATEEMKQRINAVRKIVREKKWCGEVIIKEEENNRGLSRSVIETVNIIAEKHGRIIVLEDDLITHRKFLSFCNEGLNFYRNCPDVYGISGFAFGNGLISTDTCLLPIGSSWGWATWNDKWKDFNKDSKELLQQIKQSGKENEFDFGNYPYMKMLEDNVKGSNDSWAIRFYASMFLKKGSFLFPKNTLIQNIGFDNSGVHCDTDQIFNLELLEYDFNINEIPSSINKENIKSIKKYLSYNLKLSERKAGIKNIINKIIQKFSNKKPVQFSSL